ncbi:MAG: AAA family ATPase, partial [Candidatus Levyibacteriota bacterium]
CKPIGRTSCYGWRQPQIASMESVTLHNIRIITVSGRIASGSTTLAKKLAQVLVWKHVEGGEIFWEAVRKKMNLSPEQTNLRPDEEDELFDKKLKDMLQREKNIVLETKLAGFNAQGVEGIFKVLVLCEDKDGNDKTEIRIDRLLAREHMSLTEAKEEVLTREKNDIEKWQRLYAPDDPNWTYWDKKYYDLVINTYSSNPYEALVAVLQAVKKGVI